MVQIFLKVRRIIACNRMLFQGCIVNLTNSSPKHTGADVFAGTKRPTGRRSSQAVYVKPSTFQGESVLDWLIVNMHVLLLLF